MDLRTQNAIPPPIQADGLRPNLPIDTPVSPQPHIENETESFGPHFDHNFLAEPRRVARKVARRVHRTLNPFVLVVGYLTSAGIGLWLGDLILRWLKVQQ
jgi:hypothetical protein